MPAVCTDWHFSPGVVPVVTIGTRYYDDASLHLGLLISGIVPLIISNSFNQLTGSIK